MNSEEKLNLITRNLQEVITEEELKKLVEEKEEISLYWGTMPTGSPHVAYFFPLIKIADFLKAGLKVKILIADLHAALDGVSWELLEKRFTYYDKAIRLMLEALEVNTEKLEFVKGSDIELNKEYFNDVLKMSSHSSTKECLKAASEVVKMGDNPKLSGLIYPIMQALDEEYLKADIQFGGLDQRKIFVFAREKLPTVGYKPRIELMNPMIRGLIGEKMSASIPQSKIDILDDEETVNKKVNKADFIEGDANNGLMAFAKYIIFTIKQDKNEALIIERPEKFGGNLSYQTYEELEKEVINKKLHPLDFKKAVAKEINILLKHLRENSEIKEIYSQAYPKK